MLRESSGIWGKVIAIGIVLAMLFSTGFALTETAAAEPLEQVDNLTPPYPPFMIWGTVYGEDVPVSDAAVTITNLMTGESMEAAVYGNGAYDTELENLQHGYSIGDEIEITAMAGENTASRIIVVKQMGFGKRIDIYFGDGANTASNVNLLSSNKVLNEPAEFDMMTNYERPIMPSRPRDSDINPNTIYIDSPATVEEPEPEISLTDIRCPPYFRLAFTSPRSNQLELSIRNGEASKEVVIVDLYHVEPDGTTESFLKTVHFGMIQPGQTKTKDAYDRNDDMWTPTERGRNWIRGEIYIMGHGNNRIFVNEFKESFWIVPGWRSVLELGTTVITEPTTWDNFTVIIDGDLYVNAPLDIVNTDVIGDDLVVTDEYSIHAGSSHNMACPEDGQYKVEVNPDGTLNIWDALTNDPDDNHYWFYMNGTLNVGRELPIFKPGLVENVMGSPDLSQPGGIICTTDSVRI